MIRPPFPAPAVAAWALLAATAASFADFENAVKTKIGLRTFCLRLADGQGVASYGQFLFLAFNHALQVLAIKFA